MSPDDLTEAVGGIRITEEMKQRADSAPQSQAAYVRGMWLAGESAVAELDPRVGDNAAGHGSEIKSAEDAAKALDDAVILSQLSDGPQSFEDVVRPLVQEFENVLANRLKDMEYDDKSAVTSDAKGNFWLEE